LRETSRETSSSKEVISMANLNTATSTFSCKWPMQKVTMVRCKMMVMERHRRGWYIDKFNASMVLHIAKLYLWSNAKVNALKLALHIENNTSERSLRDRSRCIIAITNVTGYPLVLNFSNCTKRSEENLEIKINKWLIYNL
jgi:hypothetical protein